MQTEFINCPLCSAQDYQALLVDYDRITGIPGCFILARCSRCELMYVNPRPAKEELSRFYNGKYFAYLWNWDSKVYESIKKKVEFGFYRYLRDSSLYKFLWKIAMRMVVINGRFNLGLLRIGTDSEILDIGCGTGAFLERIRWLTGCKVRGVEQNATARRIGNDLLGEKTILPELSEDCGLKEGSFDIVTMWFIFEHLTSPLDTLKKVNRLLKNNGRLVMAIPNAQSWSWLIFKKRWTALDLPRHLMLLTPKTAKQFLANSDFKVEKIKYINCPDVYFISAQSLFLKTKLHLRKNFPITLAAYLLNLILSPLGLLEILFHRSALIIIYARKLE